MTRNLGQIPSARHRSPPWWRRWWPVWSLLTCAVVALAGVTSMTVRRSGGGLAWTAVILLLAGLIAGGRILGEGVAGGREEKLAILALPCLGVVGATAPLLLRAAWTVIDQDGDYAWFLVTAAVLWAVVAAGCWWALWGSELPGLWAGLCAVAGVAYPLAARFACRMFRVERGAEPELCGALPWNLILLGLLVVYAAGAGWVAHRRERSGMKPALAALAAAVVFLAAWLIVHNLTR